jgi:phenylacetate-coenzyme A ligase PaaK-like adenylate-forming protein
MTKSKAQSTIEQRLSHVLRIHFHPEGGSPYWLERETMLGIDARAEIRSVFDLVKLGPMEERALTTRPIEDFMPRSLLNRRYEFVIAETAGTLGRPKFCVHRRDEFHEAFVEPFVLAAQRAAFPRGLNWLFIGPSGPHIIGKAAVSCANAMGSPDPFTIDLDPRWAKQLMPGTFGWRRYLQHVEAQVLKIIESQNVGVLFSTPIVLESVASRVDECRRNKIRGIHLGGVAVSARQRAMFVERFPNAVILSGYGNSLFGVMPELAFSSADGFAYYPHGTRLVARIVPADGGTAEGRLQQDVPFGQRGQVVISRLDETQLIVNMMERDSAVRIAALSNAVSDGFSTDGVLDPKPIVNPALKPAVGFY